MIDEPESDAIRFYLKTRTTYDLTDFEIWENHSAKLERERDEAREVLRMISVADWKTAGELRGMARRALEAAK